MPDCARPGPPDLTYPDHGVRTDSNGDHVRSRFYRRHGLLHRARRASTHLDSSSPQIQHPSLLTLGVLGNLVSILIYFISASGVTIFGVPPQPLIAFGVLIKALEAVFVVASLYVLKALKAERH